MKGKLVWMLFILVLALAIGWMPARGMPAPQKTLYCQVNYTVWNAIFGIPVLSLADDEYGTEVARVHAGDMLEIISTNRVWHFVIADPEAGYIKEYDCPLVLEFKYFFPVAQKNHGGPDRPVKERIQMGWTALLDENDKEIGITGDLAWDLAAEFIANFDDLYNRFWNRPATPEEVASAIEFVTRGRIDLGNLVDDKTGRVAKLLSHLNLVLDSEARLIKELEELRGRLALVEGAASG